MDAVVEAVARQAGTARVVSIRLEVGELAGVARDALDFCFEVCVRGTPLDGASLDIVPIPGRARCRSCGSEDRVEGPIPACKCGSLDLVLVAGRELRIKHVEVIDVP
jgi:hydrogenase nickel incorporation protein HypA/HybF